MSIHFYQDDAGYVGEPEPERDYAAEASEAMRDLFSAVEALGMLTDRREGDSGADVQLIEGWTERVERLCEEVRTHLGKARVMRGGRLVAAGSVGL